MNMETILEARSFAPVNPSELSITYRRHRDADGGCDLPKVGGQAWPIIRKTVAERVLNSINAKKGTSPLHFLIEATSGGP